HARHRKGHLALDDMQIGVADTAGLDPKKHLTDIGRRLNKGLRFPPYAGHPSCGGQRSWSDGVWCCSNSIGLNILILEWRRVGLYQHSIHSKMALASSSRVFHVFWSRTSSCRVPQNDSIMALS